MRNLELPTTYLLEYTPSFEAELLETAQQVKDWSSVLSHFNIGYSIKSIPEEKFINCPRCRSTDGIILKLNAPHYPRWRCCHDCQSVVGGSNYIALFNLFNVAKSPRQLLEELQIFIGRVKPRKNKRAVKPTKATGRVRPTRPKPSRALSTEQKHLVGCLFQTREIVK